MGIMYLLSVCFCVCVSVHSRVTSLFVVISSNADNKNGQRCIVIAILQCVGY